MTRYITLLRGINVGTTNRVKMDALRVVFEHAGLHNVSSYIQSGNIFFDSDIVEVSKLQQLITNQIKQELGIASPVMLRTVEAFTQMIKSDPFSSRQLADNTRFAVTFYGKPIQTLPQLPIISEKGDFEIIGASKQELFCIWHVVRGRPPSDALLAKLFPDQESTTRFYHTCLKILAAANKN